MPKTIKTMLHNFKSKPRLTWTIKQRWKCYDLGEFPVQRVLFLQMRSSYTQATGLSLHDQHIVLPGTCIDGIDLTILMPIYGAIDPGLCSS